MTSDSDTEPAFDSPTPDERRWAVLRIILGTGQIGAATVSAYLLFETGINGWSLGGVVVTALLVAASKALFRGA